jgi:hypothetical protein
MTKDKWISIIKGAALAAGGAALTYLRTAVLPMLPPTPLEASGWAVILNIVRKILT